MMQLFKTLAELKGFLGSAIQAEDNFFQDFISAIQTAELFYIVPILGDDEYAALRNNYWNNGLTTPQELLLPQVQRTLAWYALANDMPGRITTVGALGIHENDSSNSTPARLWTYKEALFSAQAKAETFAEFLLSFLEKNQSNYPDWVASPAYTFNTELLINSATALAKYLPFSNQRMAYLKVRAMFRTAEKFYIEKNISKALLDALKTEALANTLVGNRLEAYELAKSAEAHYGFALSIPQINLTTSGQGMLISSFNDGLETRAPMDSEAKKELIEQNNTLANSYLVQIIVLMKANLSDFPEYETSSLYVADQPSFYEPFDNSDTSLVVL